MSFKDIAALEAALGHKFARPELLEQALTHSSLAREQEAAHPGSAAAIDNEQFEFLGDAVLGFVTGEDLFHRFPQFHEGQLSKLRAHLVSEKHLVRVAQQLELGEYLRLGRGEEKSGGRGKTTLLADAFEAVLAALYLDGGLEPARRVVLDRVLLPELEHLARNGHSLPVTDYKSALQERLQSVGLAQPSYVLVKQQGPEHQKLFTVEVRLPRRGTGGKEEFVGRAEGSTKKEAEQDAARQALEYLAAAAESEAALSKGSA